MGSSVHMFFKLLASELNQNYLFAKVNTTCQIKGCIYPMGVVKEHPPNTQY
jgi:hypothetical protein